MKKVIILLLAVMVLLSFTACSSADKKERKKLEALANKGKPEDIHNLAEFYYWQKGNDKYQIKARELYLEAAEMGYYPAMRAYALNQGKSKIHYTMDYFSAYTWLNLAVAFCPDNKVSTLEKERDEYKERLSKEQVAEAQDKALELYEKITGIKIFDPDSSN